MINIKHHYVNFAGTLQAHTLYEEDICHTVPMFEFEEIIFTNNCTALNHNLKYPSSLDSEQNVSTYST